MIPKLEMGILNAMKQGKPKFEALNNSEAFDIDWHEPSSSILFTNSKEAFLYTQEGSIYREVPLAKSSKGLLSGVVGSFENDFIRVQSLRIEES